MAFDIGRDIGRPEAHMPSHLHSRQLATLAEALHRARTDAEHLSNLFGVDKLLDRVSSSYMSTHSSMWLSMTPICFTAGLPWEPILCSGFLMRTVLLKGYGDHLADLLTGGDGVEL
jgi:hypothetical protein